MRVRCFVLSLGLLSVAGCSQCGTSGGRSSTSTTGVAELAVGAGQACVRMVDRSVHCWGSNRLGSVGVKGPSPTRQFHATPVRVPNVTAERILLVGTRTCFEPPGGRLSCWGSSGNDEKPVGALGCTEDSQPLHRVRLSAYSIDKALVTVNELEACVNASKCPPAPERYARGGGEAARNVTWEQARAYCAWKGLRLATEAEWERAAGIDGFVIDKKEWVGDGFSKAYYVESPVVDPKGPEGSIHRVIRGMAFTSGPRSDAVTFRYGKEPSYRDHEIGFRCALGR